MKKNLWRVSLLTIMSMLGGLSLAAPASAAVPSAPPSCSAVVNPTGGWDISWARPLTSDSPIYRYAIRAKGQTDPTIQLNVTRGTENPSRSYHWTDTVAGASSPLTFLVRGVNDTGPGAWCEAPVGATNQAPSVSAGPDLSVTLPNAASLDGTVSDDGLPAGSTVTQTWSEVSGPGTVTFANNHAVDTTAAFGAAGSYVLRLTATDGALAASDDVNVTVASGVNPHVAVRVFPQNTGSTYSDHAAVLATLGRLGVDRVSGKLAPNMDSSVIQFYQDAYNLYGIKVWFAVGTPDVALTSAQWTDIRNTLEGPLKGIVEVASGWNEPNSGVSGDWVTKTANHQAQLWSNIQQVNSESGQSIEVGTPPLWSGNISQQYTDLNTFAPTIQGKYNLINWHLYPHCNTGTALQDMIDTQKQKFQAAYGSSWPILSSESGLSTYSGGSCPITPQQQADQIDDLINDHLARGIDISYFELLDDVDPSNTNKEANWGLVETPGLDSSTWYDKPAFAVFQTLTD